jgi:hypothetical protein
VSAPFRNVFFFEVLPEHWVQVNMKGDFDGDVWRALKDFVDRHATRPASANPPSNPDGCCCVYIEPAQFVRDNRCPVHGSPRKEPSDVPRR